MKYDEACKHRIFLTEGYNQCWGITSYMSTQVSNYQRNMFFLLYSQKDVSMGFKNPELLGLFHANPHIFMKSLLK